MGLWMLSLPSALDASSERLRVFRMPAPSLHQTARAVRVYLPASYDQPTARARRYPVVILLHGWPGGEGNWSGDGAPRTPSTRWPPKERSRR